MLVLIATTGYGQSIEELIQAEYKPKPEYAEGHPYLFEEYINGEVKAASGTAENVMVRLNLADNNLLLADEGKEFILKKELIQSVTLLDKDKGSVRTFIPVNIQGRDFFVEQLFAGDDGTKYVKWHRKQFMKAQPQAGFANGAMSSDRFEQKQMYLIVLNGKAVEYTGKKSELVEVLSENDAEMEAFLQKTIKEKKIKTNKEEGIITLLKERSEYLKSKA